MKKKWLLMAAFFMSFPLICKEELALGEETIKPLKYPKFSLSTDYNLNRKYHGLADPSLRANLENRMSAALSFEAGLYKYLNAGALVGFNIPTDISKGEPLHYRFDLFAKPYFALGERFSFFSRLGGGISAAQGDLLRYLTADDANKAALQKVYSGTNYEPYAFGGNAFALAGIEYFPWSRFGMVLEAGIRAEILRNNKSKQQWNKEKLEAQGVNVEGPSSFSYMIYEFPVGLMFHIIL